MTICIYIWLCTFWNIPGFLYKHVLVKCDRNHCVYELMKHYNNIIGYVSYGRTLSYCGYLTNHCEPSQVNWPFFCPVYSWNHVLMYLCARLLLGFWPKLWCQSYNLIDIICMYIKAMYIHGMTKGQWHLVIKCLGSLVYLLQFPLVPT